MSKTDLELYFEYKCWEGLKKRGLDQKPEYIERLKYEIDVVEQMGFCGYFLIVQDFILWARQNDILTGAGRGSASGAIITYCLYITNGIDPIENGLYFERFLNPGRKSYPDIDIDFEQDKREMIVEYLSSKYGEDYVSQIGTFGTMKAKQAIQKVCKVLGFSIATGENLRKLCLPPVHGKPQPLSASIEKVPELIEYNRTPTPEKEILKWALRFENSIASVGQHASGFVISGEPIYNKVPLYKAKNKKQTTQWDMGTVEDVGYIKFDLLGLATLDKMRLCLDFIQARHGKKIDIDNIDTNDKATYEYIQKGNLLGIFQLETSTGMADLTMKVKPQCLADLAAIVAAFRPGPLQSAGLQDYLAWRNGAPPKYLIPEFEPILKNTGGFLLYQEQIMAIARQCADYSLADADNLRKAMGKKKLDVLKKEKERFKKGWIEHKLPSNKFEILWGQLLGFADYAFNAAHAFSYGFLAYQTAYLKTHYPVEFMAACMTRDFSNPDQMIQYLGECLRMSIEVLPPDVNQSNDFFTIVDDSTIRFGLMPIRNIGEKPAKEIIQKRMKLKSGYQSLPHFCRTVHLGKVNKMKVESLVLSGAFDRFGCSRAAMLKWMEKYWAYREDYKNYEKKMLTYQKRQKARLQRLEEIENGEKKKPLKEPIAPEKPTEPELIDIEEFPPMTLMEHEHHLLGLFVSGHPLDLVKIQGLDTIALSKDLPNGSFVSIMGLMIAGKEHTTKKKKKMMFLTIEDLTGRIEGVIFPQAYEQFKRYLKPLTPLVLGAKIEITETDEGDKLGKLIINNVEMIDVRTASKKAKLFRLEIPASKIKKLSDNIEEGKEKAEISLIFSSGARINIQNPIHLNKNEHQMKKVLDI